MQLTERDKKSVVGQQKVMTKQKIEKVAVLGAGVMGAQIAGHFANAKIPVVLFDLKAKDGAANAIIDKSLATLKKLKPAPLGRADALDYITAANYEDNLETLKHCDLIIEAVAERMDIKEKLYHKIAPFIKTGAIFASNTSGLSINKLASFVPETLKSHFCGIHFFNPPRYMSLVELIPQKDIDQSILPMLESFLVTKLGKSVIIARDTPNFIANRLGVFSMLVICHYAKEYNIPLEIVDQLTGKKLGRAKSATMRTADVVGLDTFAHVVDTMKNNLKDGWQNLYDTPDFIKRLIENGSLGQKSKKGIYVKSKEGLTVIDLTTGDYRLSDKKANKEVIEILNEKDWAKRLKALREHSADEAQFLWATFRDVFHYAAAMVGEISDYPRDMDMAIRWGFGWKQGIFEIWQLAGWQNVADWINEDIAGGKTISKQALPDWVFQLKEGVYGDNKQFDYATKTLEKRHWLPIYDRQIFKDQVIGESISVSETVLYEDAGVKLWTIDGSIGILSFKTKMCAIGLDVLNGIEKAIAVAEDLCQGMVIWQKEDLFSVGANLEEFGFMFMMNGKDAVAEVIKRGHEVVTQKLRYSKIPVVAAVKGFAFGGGCEIVLHCDAAVAAFETYIGLVEAGVGIIPGWGGSKEMAYRASQAEAPWKEFEKRYKNLAMAEVATSGFEAMEKGFLRASDTVVMNTREILSVAIKKAKFLAFAGYEPPLKKKFKVFGETGIATIKALLVNLRDGNQISAHDYKIACNLADAMCGGQIEKDTLVSEEWMLKRELDNFIELALSEKSAARMQHMLETGKPLRN